MRIINAMFGRGRGGIEQALVDYCEALRHAGHEPVAVVRPDAAVLPLLRARGIPVHTLANLGEWDPWASFRLRRLLKRLAPDACIAHGNRAISLLVAAGAPRIVGVMHNYKIDAAKLDFLFYPTQDLLAHLQADGAGGKHLYFMPNLVRVPDAEPERHWHEPPVIGAIGRFVAKKGFHTFIEALALVKTQGFSFKAVLAGDGEEGEALKSLARAKGLENELRFPGWAEDKQAFFDSVDIFCLPSHHEPFGIALLEAMAQALPVVAADSEGPSEILAPSVDGMLVPKDNPEALAHALMKMLQTRHWGELLARNAYDTVKNRYCLPVVARKLDLALRAIAKL